MFHALLAAAGEPLEYGKAAGRAIALGFGAGGGAAGAGAGIGAVFNASIQSKTRQPELRAEVERDQWLGFALTEACFFYGLVGGFIAFFL
jgi:F-type H+-transporting ATPase subunit c